MEKSEAERGYAEALWRIEKAERTGAEELYLMELGITQIPPKLWSLHQLEILELFGNSLTYLPPEISKLSRLKSLNLSGNQLTCLPPEIGQLAVLSDLELNSNQLSSLPSQIKHLYSLNILGIANNKFTDFPLELIKLKNLGSIHFGNNLLINLPKIINQFERLMRLDVSGNKLSILPESLLDYSGLKELYLHGNHALGLPPEILGPEWLDVFLGGKKPRDPAEILKYYFETRIKSGRRALNEVKVILVGQGSVGKTSLVKRMVYDRFNKRERKTEGIYIEKKWCVDGKKSGEQIQVNFWDFGGQEIMHATHQFFLTKRTVYLLVLDARKGENESNVQYWLKVIESFGGDSPVLVVTNKCDAHHLELNETRLKKDNPNIVGFFRTSCETGEGIEKLKEGIIHQINSKRMKHVFDLLPKAYFEVKKKLEELANQENYIDIRKYYDLCAKEGVTEREEQDVLLRFLHDLGSVLSFNDPDSPFALREMSVLNPDWVTEGVYKILNHKELSKEKGGVLEREDLGGVLKGKAYPADCHPYIVDMMHKFELCFTIQEKKKWLVAELLPVNEPEKLGDWEKALRFQYQYEVLPPGIICRFIVRRYEEIIRPAIYWRSGVVLQHDGCKALVRSDRDKGIMHISIAGPDNCRRSFLSVLRDEFRRIHATIPNLKPREMVPLPDQPEVRVSYEHLLKLEQEKVKDFFPEGADRKYTVEELLDGIENPWLRHFGPKSLFPPFFVIEPQTSFADAWEVFCCEVLNRDEKTKDIYKRKPPEGGVDLYWPDKRYAYQCKSVEDEWGRFSVEKAIESIKAAMETRKTTPWDKYFLCSNQEITGKQETKLRELLPEIVLLTPSFWIPCCLEQSEHLKGRFRRLKDMDDPD